MKKILSCLMAILLIVTGFSACGSENTPDENKDTVLNTEQSQKLSIVATTFPQYDWVREILGEHIENAELTLLLDDGVDLHSFQPTVEDIAKISDCDMFIYVGGDSDSWVQDALKTAQNKDMVVINLMEVLGDVVKEEELVEGMEHSHEHAHGEIDPENVHDRPLSDWQGNWDTIETALSQGELDGFIAHQNEESSDDIKTLRENYANRWRSDYKTLQISDKTVAFDGSAAEYEYLGYKIVESDHGVSVWYGFGAKTAPEGAPSYIAFSDHEVGSDHGEAHDDDESDHNHTAHFHMRYGSESFDALTEMESWSPTFFSAGASGEEIAEAMSAHSHDHENETDEHVWLSLKNAQLISMSIAEKLAELDTQNSESYLANAADYKKRLSALDAEFNSVVDSASYDTLIFGDRFPFRYMVDDYNLDYYAAFSGCSAETEASFETIVFLSGKLSELGLKSIMVIETSDQSIARTIVQNSGNSECEVLVLDSMQSVKAADVSSGYTYLGAMEKNLEVLRTALN